MNSKAPPRKAKGKGMGAPHSETGAKIIPEEERKCPYEGCDSKGHLSGNYDKHYIIEACPLYHNKTPQECKVCPTLFPKPNYCFCAPIFFFTTSILLILGSLH